MTEIKELKSEDYITIRLFDKEEKVMVISTGDNKFDEEGDYKDFGFDLNVEEIECLNWFINNINISDYKKEITAYCNEQYEMIGDKQITEEDLEKEVFISSIAVNICEITQAYDGFVYPEISFLGECECDPEHGICIGFRDKKFLGIHSQDWTL